MKTNYFKNIGIGALALWLGTTAGLHAQQRFGGFGGFGGGSFGGGGAGGSW